MNTIEVIQKKAKEIRKDVIRMTYAAGKQGAHIGGSLSLCEIMAVLYHGVMNYKTDDMTWDKRDRLILSKGHGAISLYGALKSIGLLTEEELMSYKCDDTNVTAHPTVDLSKGIEFSSGSLGQGLSIGAGVALGQKINSHNSRVFVIIGDGECDEGSVWEAAAFIAHYNLSNICCIIDSNKLQYDGLTEDVLNLDNLADKFRSFGFITKEVDGHDVEQLITALKEKEDKPTAVICNTVKGKGVSFMEGQYKWHNAQMTEEQYHQAMKEQENLL